MKSGAIESALEIEALEFAIKNLLDLRRPDQGPKSHHGHLGKQLGNKPDGYEIQTLLSTKGEGPLPPIGQKGWCALTPSAVSFERRYFRRLRFYSQSLAVLERPTYNHNKINKCPYSQAAKG